MNRFCPKCGAEKKFLIKGFCKECFLEDHELIKLNSEFKINLCNHCGKIKLKGQLMQNNNTNLLKFIESKIKTDLGKPKFFTEIHNLNEKQKVARIQVVGIYSDKVIELNKSTILKFMPGICDPCMKATGNYWEAILQLRQKQGKKVSDWNKWLKKVEDLLNGMTKDNLARVVSFTMTKQGLDFYIASNKAAKKIVEKLSALIGTKYTHSRKQHGVDKKGNPGYRHTYCVRVDN